MSAGSLIWILSTVAILVAAILIYLHLRREVNNADGFEGIVSEDEIEHNVISAIDEESPR